MSPSLLNKKEHQMNYATYAQNVKIESLECFFNRRGKKQDVHGDGKSVKSPNGDVTFYSKTMWTTDGKFKVWVYYDPGNILYDSFEVEKPTSEEVLRVMLERATGFDAQGDKVEIAV